MYYDFSAFTGHWPYRYLRSHTLSEQLANLQKNGIEGGYLSSLDGIFYNDPWEADGRLLPRLEGSHWRLAMCINPRLSQTKKNMVLAHVRGIRALRLYPGIHRFRLDDPEVHKICTLAGELHMTVIITARMEDDRLCYLLEQQPISAPEAAALARQHGDTLFLLSGFYLQELVSIGQVPENLWADTAGLCHGLDPVTELLDGGFPREKLVFGSHSPLQCTESHLLNLPPDVKTDILEINAHRLLEESHDRFEQPSASG